MQHGSKDNSGRIEAAVAAILKRYFAAAAFFINTFQIAKKSMAKTAMTKMAYQNKESERALRQRTDGRKSLTSLILLLVKTYKG